MSEHEADYFSEGMVVRLVSGGPPMSVEKVPANRAEWIPCAWFDEQTRF